MVVVLTSISFKSPRLPPFSPSALLFFILPFYFLAFLFVSFRFVSFTYLLLLFLFGRLKLAILRDKNTGFGLPFEVSVIVFWRCFDGQHNMPSPSPLLITSVFPLQKSLPSLSVYFSTPSS